MSKINRPLITEFMGDGFNLNKAHKQYLDNLELWNYVQALDKYADDLESLSQPTDDKTKEQILELHFGSEYYKLKELGYLDNIINAMQEFRQSQPKGISDEELIKSISVNRANFEHIAKTGNINGTLWVELKRILRANQSISEVSDCDHV